MPSSEPFTRADTLHGDDHDCVCCAYARSVMQQIREQQIELEHLRRENAHLGKAVLELRGQVTAERERCAGVHDRQVELLERQIRQTDLPGLSGALEREKQWHARAALAIRNVA